MQELQVQNENASWWAGICISIADAGGTIFRPMEKIGINLVHAWNLGDLMEDLRIQNDKAQK
jgi:hypothetical protein